MDFLDLLGVPYHAPGVFFLGTDFLFKSILAFCALASLHNFTAQNLLSEFQKDFTTSFVIDKVTLTVSTDELAFH